MSFDAIAALDGYTHAAISASIVVDGATPLAIFAGVAGDRPGAFLLESVEGGEVMGRFSFFGADAKDAIRVTDGKVEVRGEPTDDRPLDAVRAFLSRYRVHRAPELPRFFGGLVGFLGYDCLACFEDVPLPTSTSDRPEAVLLFADELYVYDHVTHRLTAIVHVPLDGDRAAAYDAATKRLDDMIDAAAKAPPLVPWRAPDAPTLDVRTNQNKEAYCASVARAKEAIADGEIFQVVLSTRFSVDVALSPFELYRSLRALEPAPYMFYLSFEDFSLVGASPEVLVRLEDGELLVRPIAGTRRRGKTEAEDRAMETDLLGDEKELAEHRMLLDLGRNDLGRVAKSASVVVEDPLHVERYAHVMHIVSDVRASLDPKHDASAVLEACFPAGTVSGAPKLRAAELIAALEPDRRKSYAGAVGYFDLSGNLDTCIAIRTLLVEPNAVHLQAGAGIVFDSVPEREWEECQNKARAGLAAVAMTVAREDPS